jgi:hypothetical protein
MRVRLFSWAAALIVLGGFALAQERGDRGRGGAAGGGEGRYRAETPAVAANPSPNTNTPGTSNPSPGNSGYTGWPTGYLYSDVYYRQMLLDNFLFSLWSQYPYFAYSTCQWRYSQGDSPLNAEVIRLALQDSFEATNAILERVNHMSGLIDRLEAGQISRADFQRSFDTAADDIRNLAKTIRKDQRLEFLDQRRGVSLNEPPRATSIAQLRDLVAQLRQVTVGMRDGLERYYSSDYSRTIDVNYLKQPSFRSVSGQIDKLTKVIGKSAERL